MEVTDKDIRIMFEPKLDRKLTNTEILEIRNSMSYLGKAIYRYLQMRNTSNCEQTA